MRVANDFIDESRATKLLLRFSRQREATVRYYDYRGTEAITPSDGVTLEDLGRMALMNPRLSGNDCALMLKVGNDAAVPWDAVPHGANLVDADPEEEAGLYDRAQALYKHFTTKSGIGDAKASKLLHIKRPYLFPVLDKEVRDFYDGAARKAAKSSDRWRSTRSRLYWVAIRNDVIEGQQELAAIKAILAPDAPLVAALPDVRILDILAWELTR